MNLDLFLLSLLLLCALYTVLAKSLLKMAMGLAVASAVLAIILYTMMSPFAAVFELALQPGAPGGPCSQRAGKNEQQTGCQRIPAQAGSERPEIAGFPAEIRRLCNPLLPETVSLA